MRPIPSAVRHIARVVAVVLVAFSVVFPSLGGGGVTGTGGAARGTLTNFGSVFVNGIEFFTNGASVSIDGVPDRSEGELRVGMQLRVVGIVNPDGRTGSASTVEYDADLRGTVDAPAVPDGDGAAFRVHGLVVRTDDLTVFESVLGAAALAAGDRVEVSGLRDAGAGEIYATFVSLRSPGTGTVVSGAISSVTERSFSLGALAVDYDAASLRDVPAGGLANGMFLRVKAATEPFDGRIRAAEARYVSGSLGVAAGTEASAQGVVSSRTASANSLGGLVVRIDGKTRFRNGGAADLVDGAVVEAEGTVLADESLQASRITFQAPDDASANAQVMSKDAGGFWLISPNGLRVEVSRQTRFRDRRKSGAGTFDWTTLKAGDFVSVSGLEVAEATILASEVSRVDPLVNITLRARARTVANPEAILLGIWVSAAVGTAFQDANGNAITGDVFFAKAAGRRVKATGLVTGADSIGATALEIEP